MVCVVVASHNAAMHLESLARAAAKTTATGQQLTASKSYTKRKYDNMFRLDYPLDYPLIWFSAALAFGTEDLTHLTAGWLLAGSQKGKCAGGLGCSALLKKAEHVMQRSEAV